MIPARTATINAVIPSILTPPSVLSGRRRNRKHKLSISYISTEYNEKGPSPDGEGPLLCCDFLQQDVLQDEENGQHIHEGADLLLLGLAGDHIDDGRGDDADGDALRDAVGSGHSQDGQEGGNALAGVGEVDLDGGR